MDCSIHRSRLGSCKRNRAPIYADLEDRVHGSFKSIKPANIGYRSDRAIDHIAEASSQIEFDLDKGYDMTLP